MINEMILFEAFCHYCKKNPGLRPKSDVQWLGFLDADTQQYVCLKCKERHYTAKFRNPELIGLYSEMPVIIAPVNEIPIRHKLTPIKSF